MEKQTENALEKDTAVGTVEWFLPELGPDPLEEWDRLRRFVDLSGEERKAMLASIPALFRRGYELVVANYDYLLANPETAQILGWDSGADPAHLDERRRFFTIWLARLLGMDTSHEFARYLFRAGQMHAGYGPRKVQVPPVYITGAISLMNVAFARVLNEEMPGDPGIPMALAGWNKTLSLHLHMMLLGYESARQLADGEFRIPVTFYGRMRTITGATEISVGALLNAPVTRLLRKLFDFYPQARTEALEVVWQPGEHMDAFGNPWMTVNREYRPKRGWRVLLNGRGIDYLTEEQRVVRPGDTLQVFPPGR